MWRIRVSAILGGIGLIMMMCAGCYLNSPGGLAYIAAAGVMAGMTLLYVGAWLHDRAVAAERLRRRREYARRKRAAEREAQMAAQRGVLFFHWCNDCSYLDLDYPADNLLDR